MAQKKTKTEKVSKPKAIHGSFNMKLRKTRKMSMQDLAGIDMLKRVWKRLQEYTRTMKNDIYIQPYCEAMFIVHKIEDRIRRGDFEPGKSRYPNSVMVNPKKMRQFKVLLPKVSEESLETL